MSLKNNRSTLECNFDSIVGLTHNYAGLAYGNVASAKHQNETAFPRQAALQGLEKMWQVAGMGIPQAVLPPLVRPDVAWLRSLGFSGDDATVIQTAATADPVTLAAACSASSMWAANAATVAPSVDCNDDRVHFSIANLNSSMHRSTESRHIEAIFRAIFSADEFCVHSALPSAVGLTDEGAANHTRLCSSYGQPGLHIFVYGRDALNVNHPAPRKFPARQTLQASQAIARRHCLSQQNTFFVQQSPEAIDAGVFHNDVISVGNGNLFLTHESAFIDQEKVLKQIEGRFSEISPIPLRILTVTSEQLSLSDAVNSYLFNSQLLSLAEGGYSLVCPADCQSNAAAYQVIQNWLAEGPIREVKFVDLRQSMNNGGGPACLRLRVVLTEAEQAKVAGRVWLDRELYEQLQDWVQRWYPEQLTVAQLADPGLLERSRGANQELGEILQLELSS